MNKNSLTLITKNEVMRDILLHIDKIADSDSIAPATDVKIPL